MGWQRRNKKMYYYHTININGRYVNLYCGGGEEGRRAEAMFEGMAEGRRLAREVKRKATKGTKRRRPRPSVGSAVGATAGA